MEIGVEELPAADVDTALTQLRERVPLWLAELGLEHGPARIHATPRRLAVFVEALSPRQPDREDLAKGPSADRAFDKDGVATPAAIGFAKGKGLAVKDLQIREYDGNKYVVAVVKKTGRPAPEVLAEALPAFVAGIKFEKSMKWNSSGVAFSRPVRWLVALLGETVIPFEYAGVAAGNVSRGLRPYDSPETIIPSADQYFDVIRQACIVLDLDERSRLIVEMVKKAAASVGGEAIIEPGLLAEVTNLIEMPTAVLGGFNADFLALPRDVLISVMKKHQRYFPVESRMSNVGNLTSDVRPSTLLPYFIAIRNGDSEYLDTVKHGNEHVLGARFADANFFVREDVKQPLEYYRAGLEKLIFQTKLGSMLDKSERMLKLSAELAQMLHLTEDEIRNTQRATFLAKADLTTQMVTEMTSLQGIIGREYALRSGEDKDVAVAIGEQYQPIPHTNVGLAVALADRIDSLVGLFAAGLIPTGAKDPFGLRRAAIGTVQPLIEHDLDFDLRVAVEKSAATQPIPVSDEVKTQVLEFIAGRLRVVLADDGFRHDVVDAVLAAQSHDPAACARAAHALQAWVVRPDWDMILPAFARCVRITRSQRVEQQSVDPALFVEAEEKQLYDAMLTSVACSACTVDEFLNIIVILMPAINLFFDKVLVMAEDPQVKQNRLALVQSIVALSSGIADFSKLAGF